MRKTLVLLLVIIAFASNALAAPSPAGIRPVEYEKGVVLFVSPLEKSMQKEYLMEQGELVTIQLTTGPEAGKTVDTFNYISPRSPYAIRVKPGDKIIVAIAHDMGRTTYHVSDFDRFDYIYVLVGLFALTLIVFGGIVGFKSIFVIAFSTLFIFKFFISQVLASTINLTLLTLIVCAIIAILAQITISGRTIKTYAAILGTVGGVAIAGVLSAISIKLMHLNGLDTEEAMMLKATLLPSVDFEGLLFAGMVFGALGAVMDTTISISSALAEVKQAKPSATVKELFLTGMNVGRDVMGTMSNTLILAYTGSSLPLMLLIAAQENVSMLKILNLNMIVTEIARAMTGSIGLICAIPLTAIITAFLLRGKS
ncbi:MAG: YibE/F family protein [Negativicutes bacterium]|nr:YibE/F family protein [Negativicutes bacterium]